MTRRMKDSGIEWIGIIPDAWDVKPIKTCFKERNEKVSDYEWEPLSVTKQGIVKQLENAAKSDAHDARKKVCRGDFVINSRSDRKQSCGLSDYNGSVSLINIVLKSEKMFNGYVKYLLKNYGFAEEFYRWGTGIVADLWSTNFQRMKKIMIPIPPHDEQEKIADFLDDKISEIDTIISKTKASIEEYKKYKVGVITEAVLGSDRDGVIYKDVDNIFIKRIPIEWEFCKLKYLSEEIGDGLHSTPEYDNEGDVYFINGNNIGGEYLEIKSSTNKLNDLEYSKYKKPLLNDQTIMIALNGATYGKLSFYNFEKVLLGKSAGYITLKDDINKRYIKYYLQSSLAKNFMSLSLNGTTIQNLSLGTLNEMLIIIPTVVEQQEIADYLAEKCGEIDALIAKKEAFVEEMEAYKKSLIYEYVTGKKEVK